jgi:hypothetical protein|uniref:Uncharacterized protein n=1 Tax=viral metagenome TaxID=1070528 RepID=A0A6C0CDZ1_9ZZZZ
MLYCITLKNTSFKEIKVKNIDSVNIYKKCGYKSNNNFKKLYAWDCGSTNVIEVWSKQDNNVKTYNNHPLLVKYNIKVNINNKCIFVKTNGVNYINLESTFFSKFFDLPETIEFNSNEDIQEDTYEEINDGDLKTQDTNINQLNEILCTNKNNSDVLDNTSDTNSELSYELYCYSDEEP